MRAIFLLASKARYHIPKVGEFLYSPEFEPFCGGFRPFVYQGRAFGPDEIAEANLASSRILDSVIPNLGYQVTVRFLADEECAAVAPETVTGGDAPAETITGQTETVTKGETAPETVTETAPGFELRGRSIFIGEDRVATLYGGNNSVRVFKEELREALNTWLAGQAASKADA